MKDLIIPVLLGIIVGFGGMTIYSVSQTPAEVTCEAPVCETPVCYEEIWASRAQYCKKIYQELAAECNTYKRDHPEGNNTPTTP